MTQPSLTVRELQAGDIPAIADYWLHADADYMKGMGVDLAKLPSRQEWEAMLTEQINTPLQDKKSYCLIWEVDGRAIGHSNINKIIPGKEAYMHLHIWDPAIRSKGYGRRFIHLSIPYFFKGYNLQTLYCEPYALNHAPNRTLEQAGFRFVRAYVTTPGWINFEQTVRLYEMPRAVFEQLAS
jgi:RimJ/RimL family protein N-acetyltransferase